MWFTWRTALLHYILEMICSSLLCSKCARTQVLVNLIQFRSIFNLGVLELLHLWNVILCVLVVIHHLLLVLLNANHMVLHNLIIFLFVRLWFGVLFHWNWLLLEDITIQFWSWQLFFDLLLLVFVVLKVLIDWLYLLILLYMYALLVNSHCLLLFFKLCDSAHFVWPIWVDHFLIVITWNRFDFRHHLARTLFILDIACLHRSDSNIWLITCEFRYIWCQSWLIFSLCALFVAILDLFWFLYSRLF